MKRLRVILPLLLLLFSLTLKAQPKSDDKIDLLRVAFITKKLNLTTEEAEKFWPIYNDYQDKREAARKKLIENHRKIKRSENKGDTLSTADLEEIIEYEASFDETDAKLKREMNTKLKKVLPVKKIALLYLAEDEFKKELLRQLTEAEKKSADTAQNKKGN